MRGLSENRLRIVSWRFIAGFAREIRRERYEVALNFQANLKGAMHALLSGAPRRVGFSRAHCKEAAYFFDNEHVAPAGGERINRVEKFLSLAATLGAPVEGAASIAAR